MLRVIESIAMAWWTESLLSNLADRVRIPAEPGILISILALSLSLEYILSYAVSGGGPDIVLTKHSEGTLVYLSI